MKSTQEKYVVFADDGNGNGPIVRVGQQGQEVAATDMPPGRTMLFYEWEGDAVAFIKAHEVLSGTVTPKAAVVIEAMQAADEIAEYHREIHEERTRRIEAGTKLTLTDHPSQVHPQGRPVDRANMSDMAQLSQILIASGDTTTMIPFRDADNIDHQLTPAQIVELYMKCFEYVQAVMVASWALKDGPPVGNVSDDANWPARALS